MTHNRPSSPGSQGTHDCWQCAEQRRRARVARLWSFRSVAACLCLLYAIRADLNAAQVKSDEIAAQRDSAEMQRDLAQEETAKLLHAMQSLPPSLWPAWAVTSNGGAPDIIVRSDLLVRPDLRHSWWKAYGVAEPDTSGHRRITVYPATTCRCASRDTSEPVKCAVDSYGTLTIDASGVTSYICF